MASTRGRAPYSKYTRAKQSSLSTAHAFVESPGSNEEDDEKRDTLPPL